MEILLVVHGFVQGVGYRHFVRSSAEKNGILGEVQNMPDGSVRIIAKGSKEDLASFEKEIQIRSNNGPDVMYIEKYAEGSSKFPKGVVVDSGFRIIKDRT